MFLKDANELVLGHRRSWGAVLEEFPSHEVLRVGAGFEGFPADGGLGGGCDSLGGGLATASSHY